MVRALGSGRTAFRGRDRTLTPATTYRTLSLHKTAATFCCGSARLSVSLDFVRSHDFGR